MGFKFDRKLLKKNAKIGLKRYYWAAFGVSLLARIINYISTSISNRGSGVQISNDQLQALASGDSEAIAEVSNAIANSAGSTANIGTMAVATLISAAIAIFVINIISIGKSAFFLKSRTSEAKVAYLGDGFKKNYMGSVGKFLVVNLIVLGWTLLAIVPYVGAFIALAFAETAPAFAGIAAIVLFLGFIALLVVAIAKAYQFSQTPYILANDPDISLKDLIARNKAMTKGYKHNLFWLDVSFIPLYLVGFLACCIGTLFVNPYVEATKAEAFCFLDANLNAQNGETPAAAAPAAEAPATVEAPADDVTADAAAVAAAVAAPAAVAAIEIAAADAADEAAEEPAVEAVEAVEEAAEEAVEAAEESVAEAVEAVEEAAETAEEAVEEAAEAVEEAAADLAQPELTQPELTSAEDVAEEIGGAANDAE